jgi:hypothetical protein
MWMLCEAPESGCGAWESWEPAGERPRGAGWDEDEEAPDAGVPREQAFRLVQNLARHYGPEGPPLRRRTARLRAAVLLAARGWWVRGRGCGKNSGPG